MISLWNVLICTHCFLVSDQGIYAYCDYTTMAHLCICTRVKELIRSGYTALSDGECLINCSSRLELWESSFSSRCFYYFLHDTKSKRKACTIKKNTLVDLYVNKLFIGDGFRMYAVQSLLLPTFAFRYKCFVFQISQSHFVTTVITFSNVIRLECLSDVR